MEPRSKDDLKHPHQSADASKAAGRSADDEVAQLHAEFNAAAERLRRARADRELEDAELDRREEIEVTAAAAGERGEAGAT